MYEAATAYGIAGRAGSTTVHVQPSSVDAIVEQLARSGWKSPRPGVWSMRDEALRRAQVKSATDSGLRLRR